MRKCLECEREALVKGKYCGSPDCKRIRHAKAEAKRRAADPEISRKQGRKTRLQQTREDEARRMAQVIANAVPHQAEVYELLNTGEI